MYQEGSSNLGKSFQLKVLKKIKRFSNTEMFCELIPALTLPALYLKLSFLFMDILGNTQAKFCPFKIK